MKAFVVGATGYTGGHVVDRLVTRGHAVVAHVRPGSSSAERLQASALERGFDVVEAPWERDAMRDAIATIRPDVIFALIGTTAKRARREEIDAADIYERVDYGLTSLLVGAAVASRVRSTIIYLSAMGVSESSMGAYMQARWKAETAVRNAGLPCILARPGFISGADREESRPLERGASVAANAVLGVLGTLGARGLERRYRAFEGRELAAALVAAAEKPSSQMCTVLEAQDLRALLDSQGGTRP